MTQAMQPNATDFAWNGKRRKAVELVAADDRTDAAIAADLAINKSTLERWKAHPTFDAAVRDAKAAIAAAIRAEGIVNKQHRIDSYRDDFERTERVIAARAEHYATKAPGGDTGLIVGQLKLVKHIDTTDEDGQRTWFEEQWEYVVDTSLMNERLKLRKQIAQEKGEWDEKRTLDATDGFIAALREFGRGDGDA